MFSFAKLNPQLSLKGEVLLENGRPVDFSRDPEIVKLISLLNSHPAMCTFTSCQGHFRVNVPTPELEYSHVVVEIFSLQKDSFYFLHSAGKNEPLKMDLFSDLYPNIDLNKLPFQYQVGWVRILIEESDRGAKLKENLLELVANSGDLLSLSKMGRNDLIVGFSSKLKGYAKTDSNMYMKIPWSDIPKLNQQRLRSIVLLESWASERLVQENS